MGESTNLDCSIPAEMEDPIERSEYVLRHSICNDTESSPLLPNITVWTLNTETSNLHKPEPLQVHKASAFIQKTTSPPANDKVAPSNKPQFK